MGLPSSSKIWNRVDHYQSPKIRQRQPSIIEPSEISWILQVESLRRFTFQLENLLGERRLSDLPCGENGDNREILKQ